MRRRTAAVASAVFFVMAPGVVAGLVPWWLTRWRSDRAWSSWAWGPVRLVGVAMLAVGVAVLVHAFVRFVTEGRGTPAPVAAPQRLVVGGLYRHVRNPMYVAVISTVLGQALLLTQARLMIYAIVVAAAMAAFVHGYEEPALTRRFGEDYRDYLDGVPRWWPRLRPWSSQRH